MVAVEFSGFIPQSFVDWKGVASCVVFTPGCNLRCPACHNPELVKGGAGKKSGKEIEQEIDKIKWAVEGIVITGGEPTLHADLGIFMKRMKLKNLKVKLDTNGTSPEKLRDFINRKIIDYVAMDVKAPLYPEQYERVAGRDGQLLEKVRESIRLLMESGVDYEFRTTWTPDLTEDDIKEIGRQLVGAKRLVIQQFRPGNCLDEEYNKHPKLAYETLRAGAEKVDGPKEVRIRSEEHGEERIK
ncbi:MAG: anaerobic ribonucleoside-triphosphate reductase activating protein [Candidatus Diapherotrites archaeon]|nr:anaerobic ribonucleoside-triphosphate reductase activating protein [Candidatus Diapherotrites archaeon]